MTGLVAGIGVVGLGRENDEARRVVHLVLDIGHDDLEAVDLGGERRGDGGERRILGLRDHARRAGRVGLRHRLEAELEQLAAALAQRLRVAEHALDGLQRCARQRHQLVAHAQEVLADDVEIGVGQQVMDVGDAAGDRVLDRDHGEPRFARLHRLQARPRRSGRRRLPCRETPHGRRDASWRRARPDRRFASRPACWLRSCGHADRCQGGG